MIALGEIIIKKIMIDKLASYGHELYSIVFAHICCDCSNEE